MDLQAAARVLSQAGKEQTAPPEVGRDIAFVVDRWFSSLEETLPELKELLSDEASIALLQAAEALAMQTYWYIRLLHPERRPEF